MTRLRAAGGSVLFLVVVPGIAGGLLPWLIAGRDSTTAALWREVVGWILIAAGAAVLLEAFARFVVDGIGTPAPVAPPEKLVVRGLYRYVRNPMYLAVTAVILGQAALYAAWVLVVYAAIFVAVTWSFVHWYEEPALRRRFGAEYERYLQAVPGWWPRLPGLESQHGA